MIDCEVKDFCTVFNVPYLPYKLRFENDIVYSDEYAKPLKDFKDTLVKPAPNAVKQRNSRDFLAESVII